MVGLYQNLITAGHGSDQIANDGLTTDY